ncbi:MAG: MerR family transcriptional regulator [Anderseniella sp.]|nr:MerR family transcriptional regulator [Anderseniella sp.]
MPEKPRSIYKGTIVTDKAELTIDDLCSACGLSKDKVTSYVAEGIIEPQGAAVVEWRFSRTTVVAVQRAQRLEQDLGLNEAGIALAFDLLSQIEELKRRLAHVERDSQNKRFT